MQGGKQELLDKAERYQYAYPDSVIPLSEELFRLAQNEEDSVFMGESKRLIGAYYHFRSELDSAIYFYNQALNFYEGTTDFRRLARLELSLAVCEVAMNDYENALVRLKRAEDLAEKSNSDNYRFRVIGEIARVYSMLGDSEKALEESRRYYSLVKDGDNKEQKAIALSYLSVEFMKREEYDSSIYYFKEVIAIENSRENPNLTGLGSAYQNIGNIYSNLNNNREAIQAFTKALGFYQKGKYTVGLIQVNLNLAIARLSMNETSSALRLINTALSQAKNYPDKRLLREVYKIKSDIHQERKEYQLALNSFKEFKKINDSMFNMERQETIDDLLTKYEVAEKERQLESQKAELLIQEAKLQRNQVFVFGLILILVLLVLVFLMWKSKTEKALALERQEAELKLREAEIEAIIRSQEKERNRFARDLHDGFGQLISVLKLNLNQLGEISAKDAEKRYEVYKNGESVINEMYTELRNICFDLMPQTLVKRGLMPALKEFGQRVNQTDKVSCEVLVFTNNERLNELVEISLFRITQEWVNNILKYAGADHITIQLLHDDAEITLTIEDNGKGFDPQDFYKGTGNGWKNIQTRLNQIKGEFDLDSRPEVNGTMMTVSVQTAGLLKRIPSGTEPEFTA